MDCDRVFIILTSGPFPTGADLDEHVERHLSDCPECRSLSEALRPAPELFHESLTPSESRDLPIYHAMSMTSSGWLETSSSRKHPTQLLQATINRPVRPYRNTQQFNSAEYSVKDRWINMVSSVEIGQQSDLTTVVTFVSLLALTMFSLGWIVQ